MPFRRQIGSCAFLALMFACRPASAVIVAGDYLGLPDTSVNTTASSVPDGFDYWNNVGRMAVGSAIYIGDDWVLSASHISGFATATTSFSFDDPTSGSSITVGYKALAGSFVRLTNPDGPAAGQASDLLMYKIDRSTGYDTSTLASYSLAPNLAHLFIAIDPPSSGANGGPSDSVIAIGRGIDRQNSVITWNAAWAEVPSLAHSGFKWDVNSTQIKRWGENFVSGDSQWVNMGTAGQVNAFSTTFDKVGKSSEFQATTGDSGGGVFRFNDSADRWELIGMMEATSAFTNQPLSTSVFGNTTAIADLSYYRSKILALAPMPGDVNGDTFVDIRDITIIADNWLKEGPAGDANHDGVVNIVDLTLVAQYWSPAPASFSSGQAGGSAAQAPEPSSLILASLAAIFAVAGVRRSVVRR